MGAWKSEQDGRIVCHILNTTGHLELTCHYRWFTSILINQYRFLLKVPAIYGCFLVNIQMGMKVCKLGCKVQPTPKQKHLHSKH